MAVALALCAPLAGCRITNDDIQRWEHLQHGAQKLEAVLFYPKYEDSLRLQAALALIRIPPHGYVDPFDQQPNSDSLVGLEKTLARMPNTQRDAIVALLIPEIVKELGKDPPAVQQDGTQPVDPSIPFKDAGYTLLAYKKETTLISDEALKTQLTNALVSWAAADYENRTLNRTQKYTMEQLMELIGAPGVAAVPAFIAKTPASPAVDRLVAIISKTGSPETKEATSVELVKIARHTLSKEWLDTETPILQEQNARGNFTDLTPQQFAKQLTATQDEALLRVFGNMLRIGGRATIDFAFDYAKEKDQSGKRRAGALAAIEQKLDIKAHPDDLKRLVELVKSPDSPNEVIDQAFRRIAEQDRDLVIPSLYELMSFDKWPIRREAESTLLKLLYVSDLDNFFKKLPEKEAKGFAMLEAITASATMKDMKVSKDAKDPGPNEPPPALKVITTYLDPSHTIAQRATAASYFFSWGTNADLATLKPYEDDAKNPVPVCDTDDGCKWTCVVSVAQGEKRAAEDKGWFVGDQDFDRLTGDRFESVLKAFGYSDLQRDANKTYTGAIDFKVKKGGIEYAFTLSPATPKPADAKDDWKPPEPAIKAGDIGKLDDAGATRHSDTVVLAVTSAKKADANAALDEMVKKNQDVKTFGEYVKFCVEPAIADREKQKAAGK